MDYDGTCADSTIVADGDTGKYSHTTPYPYIIADGNGARPLIASIAFHWIGGVTGSIKTYIRSNKHVIAYGDDSASIS